MKFCSTLVVSVILTLTSASRTNNNQNPNGTLLNNSNVLPKYVAVLAQISQTYRNNYVAAAVVEYLEFCGATVVIIPPSLPVPSLREIISHVQGILLPGGSMGSVYTADVEKILNIVSDMPPHNKPPVFGICAGMEAMAMAMLNATKAEAYYRCNNSNNVRKTLSMNPNAGTAKISEWLRNQRSDQLRAMNSTAMLASFHMYCLNTGHRSFDSEFILVANELYNDNPVPAIIEHKREPFYGVQFHPEKNGFERKTGKTTNHSPDAQIAMRAFGDFFMSQVNRATNSLPENMNKYLASQHCIRNVDQLSRSFTSVYVPCTVQ